MYSNCSCYDGLYKMKTLKHRTGKNITRNFFTKLWYEMYIDLVPVKHTTRVWNTKDLGQNAAAGF